MGYQTPLFLRALNNLGNSGSRLEVAVADPSPEELKQIKDREERIKDLKMRVGKCHVRYHPPSQELPPRDY